jgi:hypothetical protein
MPNNSLERTQPERDFMYDVAVLRRSARGRYAEFGSLAGAGKRFVVNILVPALPPAALG